jgi:predicted nucleic-acid-binding Zn-ribbon protein
MTDPQCTKCGSTRVMPRVFVVDESPVTSDGLPHDNPLRVRIEGNPSAWIRKDRLYGELTARICGECGYTELYVSNAGELYEKYLKAK